MKISPRRLLVCASVAALSLAIITPSLAARTPDEVVVLVNRALDHIKKSGRNVAFADFSRPDGGYKEGELYIFCFAADGTTLAHGGNPSFVGKNLINVKNPDGKFGNREIIESGLAGGHAWVDVRWPNPATNKIEGKAVYVAKVDDKTVCASGLYKG